MDISKLPVMLSQNMVMNKMQNKVAIITPVYKDTPNAYEHISMTQLSKILSTHDRFIVFPETLDISNYAQYNFSKKPLPAKYFQDIHGYNSLLTSAFFYEIFADYEYMLIAQPDTFVFEDRLEYWCNQKYDYIGAPWIFNVSDYQYLVPYLPLLHKNDSFLRVTIRNLIGEKFLVGNGGFSLRKISSAINTLHDYESEIEKHNETVQTLIHDGINTADNEDAFWALFVPTINKSFRIPKYKKALQFSFEIDPSFCYTQNKHTLPFGCHAWEKHGLEFWRPIFNDYGYEI